MSKRTYLEPGVVVADWWHTTEDGRVRCDLCPRGCTLREGQRGFCAIRQARDGGIVLTSYGRSSGFWSAVIPLHRQETQRLAQCRATPGHECPIPLRCVPAES